MRRKAIVAIVPLAVVAVLWFALRGDASAGRQKKPFVQPDPRIVNAQNQFGLNIFRQLTRGADAGANVFLSPTSLEMALAMAWNGADAGTRAAMSRVLGYEGIAPDEVNRGNCTLLDDLVDPEPKVRLAIANSLWAKKDEPFLAPFLEVNLRHYLAECTSLDFEDPGSVDRINGWIEEHTEKRIQKMLSEIPKDAILYLVNAVYFKGSWTHEFAESATRDDDFTMIGGEKKRVRMMNQTLAVPYLAGEGFDAVSLPYGDGRMSLYVFLPKTVDGIADLREKLTSEAWDKWMGSFSERRVAVQLPRFKSEYKAKLNDVLKGLGMEVAFDAEKANFRKMIALQPDENVYISSVLHQTFLEVNEEGTEAAAATVVEMVKIEMCEPSLPIAFRCDHPFVLAIRDNATGAVLFLGQVMQP